MEVAERAIAEKHSTGQNRKTKEVKLAQFDLKSMLKAEAPEPVNGVTCRITAKPLPEKEPVKVRVEWEITYTGPRSPLIILKPSLESATSPFETHISFFAVGKDENCYRASFPNVLSQIIGPGDYSKDRFITIKRKETGKGFIDVAIDDIRNVYCENEPNNFNLFELPNKFYVNLRLAPLSHGLTSGLDAWTGNYSSDLSAFQLTSWK